MLLWLVPPPQAVKLKVQHTTTSTSNEKSEGEKPEDFMALPRMCIAGGFHNKDVNQQH
jgi:hypothetical protein